MLPRRKYVFFLLKPHLCSFWLLCVVPECSASIALYLIPQQTVYAGLSHRKWWVSECSSITVSLYLKAPSCFFILPFQASPKTNVDCKHISQEPTELPFSVTEREELFVESSCFFFSAGMKTLLLQSLFFSPRKKGNLRGESKCMFLVCILCSDDADVIYVVHLYLVSKDILLCFGFCFRWLESYSKSQQ